MFCVREASILRKALAIALTLSLNVYWGACSQEAPDKPVFGKGATAYSGSASPGSPGSGVESADLSTLPSEDLPITTAGFRAEGERIYNQLCSSCHQPIPLSNRKGVDAGKILNDYTKNFPTHRGIPWPIDEEAFMIEAALAVAQP